MTYVESVQRAIDFIESHLELELDVTSIADEAYLSVPHLYRVFYALTGHPVKEYIRKRRISAAAHYLRYGDSSVSDIAMDSGFDSYHAFAKVFKKMVGMTPTAYRNADLYFSFEPIRLGEKVAYTEEKELAQLLPDVRVIRLPVGSAYSCMHVSGQEEGIEDEAYRLLYEQIHKFCITDTRSKFRIFGHNVDLPSVDGVPQYGYKMLILGIEKIKGIHSFIEETFPGGLYAVRKTPATPPKSVQEAWDRLVAEWLPKSTFELGPHQYVEEFIAYHGRLSRLNLCLPVQRKYQPETITIVQLASVRALFSRGSGAEAQKIAESRLTTWYRNFTGEQQIGSGRFYMSYQYGNRDSSEYWWENGIIADDLSFRANGPVEEKILSSGLYACCVSRTYGLLTGVLDKVHQWIAAAGHYCLDGNREWYAEYVTFPSTDMEKHSLVKVYVPVKEGVMLT